ncbi:MAG: hypothetical protein DRQ08_07705 [Candidatus Latescibacterota bacterium]|nr:MAG: hypothetical protein DRQ08_07705 [Candidatus Latescibacterota bacterium]
MPKVRGWWRKRTESARHAVEIVTAIYQYSRTGREAFLSAPRGRLPAFGTRALEEPLGLDQGLFACFGRWAGFLYGPASPLGFYTYTGPSGGKDWLRPYFPSP